MNPDLSRFRQLVTLAELGSFRRAAERLGISHSALSQTITKLESHYGTPLFTKGYRSVVVTEAGNCLARAARDMIRSLEIAEQSIEAISGGDLSGQLVLGADPIVSHARLERAIVGMSSAYPKAEFGYRQARWIEAESLLASGEVDLYIGPRPEGSGENFHFSPVRCEAAVLVCRPGHPALGPEPAALTGLHSYQVLSPRLPSKLRKAIWSGLACSEAATHPFSERATIVEDSSLMLAMVNSSDRVGWTFAEGKDFCPEGLVELARVDLSLLDAALVVACAKPRRDFPPVARFFDIIRMENRTAK